MVENVNLIEGGTKSNCRGLVTNLENKFRETICSVPKKLQQMSKKRSGSLEGYMMNSRG